MKIAIYGNKFNKEAAPYVKELFDLLVASNVDVFLNDQLCAYSSQFFNISDALTIRKKELLLDSDTDFLISVGGDGTILDTITTVRDTKVPILGVNTGRDRKSVV